MLWASYKYKWVFLFDYWVELLGWILKKKRRDKIKYDEYKQLK